ncbi:MAG: hypothetical protein ABI615_08790 [Chthoniobacterales bacterium]
MNTWWISLIFSLQIFYAIGVIAGIVLAIEVCLTLFGLDHHNSMVDGVEHADNLGFLSVRTITGFFFGFGWAGVIAIKAGWGLPLSILAACVVGVAFLLGIYSLMRALFSLRASGTLDYKNAIGQVGTVYVTVPANFHGGGQVEVLIQGRLQTISCMTKNAASIAPQTKVRVTGTVDQGTLEVELL